MPTINGWTILAHPLFLDQFERLIATVGTLKAKKPDNYQKTAEAKLLAALVQLIRTTIPSDPTATVYRQGATLGDDRKHWFRAKFGNGRFRLFFRYSSSAKVIVFAWVNDEDTKRAYESTDDAYRVFRRMLDDGRPPSDWAHLLAEARAESERLGRLA